MRARLSLFVLFPACRAFGLFVLLSVATASLAPAQQIPADQAAPQGGNGEVKSAVPVSRQVPDGAIADRLAQILGSTGWFRGVRVSVREGIVTIDGVSDTAEHRAWAGSLAEKTEGTIAVVNRLELGADFGSTLDRAGAEIRRFWRSAGQMLPLVVLAIAIAVAAWLLAAIVAALARRLLLHRIPSPLLRSIVVRAITIPVLLLGIYFVLRVAGLTRLAVTVLGGTGLIGVLVGFAFRDIAENFLASLLLSMRNPFRTGDLIEVAGETGVVQNLNTRSTVLLTLDGNHVQIPNATVYKSTIKNYSSTPTRRADFVVGIGYDSPIAKAQLLISEILRKHPAVLDKPEPLVLVEEMSAATVNLRVSYWFDSRTFAPDRTNSALLRLAKSILLQAGIELPDTAREVVFPKGVPIMHVEGERQRPSMVDPSAAGKGDAAETQDATTGEGELASGTDEVREQSCAEVPEASENLLNR